MVSGSSKPELADRAAELFLLDRAIAHETVFAGRRHLNETPPFHREMIGDWYSDIPFLCWIVFRGGAKSTIAEEGVSIMAAFREFRHCFIIGASQPKAQERLHAIRRQFEKNEQLRYTFGELRGTPWGDDRLELNTGITIQAMGRGQAIRGTKNEDFRPDLIIVDDIEDRASVATPEGRKKISDWFFDELLPSGDVKLRVRMLANDMHPECLANQLERADSGFIVKRYPIEYRNLDTGELTPMWPDRFPLEAIDRLRKQFYSQGKAAEFNANYLCRSESPEEKPFRREMFRYAGRDDTPPQVLTWQPVYAMIDPARTVRTHSATTGWAVWSRILNRLIVWEAGAKKMMPDEIVDLLFRINEEYHPVKLGFEEDGLNEWAMQPIRHRNHQLGIMAPVFPVKAPKSKFDFIRGLQFPFTAREVIFAKPLPELEAQLIGFPSGYIDAPNALAYEHHPKLAPGRPIYEDFTPSHVDENLLPLHSQPAWLALNATHSSLTAVLVQAVDGRVRILADWVREGDAGAVLGDIVREARLEHAYGVKLSAGPQHWEPYGNVGLVQAAKHLPVDIRPARLPDAGRHECRLLLRGMSRGLPQLLVSSRARWTLNGLSGGFCRAIQRGEPAEYPEESHYKTLIEGLESFLGLMQSPGSAAASDDPRLNAVAADGRRYISALANRRTT